MLMLLFRKVNYLHNILLLGCVMLDPPNNSTDVTSQEKSQFACHSF